MTQTNRALEYETTWEQHRGLQLQCANLSSLIQPALSGRERGKRDKRKHPNPHQIPRTLLNKKTPACRKLWHDPRHSFLWARRFTSLPARPFSLFENEPSGRCGKEGKICGSIINCGNCGALRRGSQKGFFSLSNRSSVIRTPCSIYGIPHKNETRMPGQIGTSGQSLVTDPRLPQQPPGCALGITI